MFAALFEVRNNVTGVQGDVSKLSDLDRLIAEIEREKGRLDIVFANAGVAKYAPLTAITDGLYDSITGAELFVDGGFAPM